nr:hypothetical protein CFP56_20359 [Quercus suber]
MALGTEQERRARLGSRAHLVAAAYLRPTPSILGLEHGLVRCRNFDRATCTVHKLTERIEPPAPAPAYALHDRLVLEVGPANLDKAGDGWEYGVASQMRQVIGLSLTGLCILGMNTVRIVAERVDRLPMGVRPV